MTVPTTISREQYATDGVTAAFTIHFPFFDDSDVNAIFVDAGGAATTLVLSSDFSVAGGNGAGGTLTTSTALAGGGTLTVFRRIPFSQEDDYVENDPLPADTLESGFDRAAMRDQQLQDALDRTLTFPVTIAPGVSAELPTPAADQLLGWNGTATALESKSLPGGTAVYSSTANTNLGTSTLEAVTPKALHDSIYNTDATIIPVTGETAAVSAGVGKVTFRFPFKMLGTAVRASLKAAQASGTILTVDINRNGASILGAHKLTIDNGEKTSTSAATPVDLSVTDWPDDAEFTIDVDQIGDGTAAGLKVTLIGKIVQ